MKQKELVDEYESICINKCPKQIHQRYEQLRYEKVCQQIKPKLNVDVEQSNNTILFNENNQNKVEITDHQTPVRSSLVPIPQIDYSPLIIKSSPKSNPKIAAKPIPTLMTTSNGNSYSNSFPVPYYSRFSAPMFKPAVISPTQHIYRSVIPSTSTATTVPFAIPSYPCQYPPNYGLNSSYYSQHQAPLFYHSHGDLANLNNKRYGEPPGPPAKRFRYNLNTYQHY